MKIVTLQHNNIIQKLHKFAFTSTMLFFCPMCSFACSAPSGSCCLSNGNIYPCGQLEMGGGSNWQDPCPAGSKCLDECKKYVQYQINNNQGITGWESNTRAEVRVVYITPGPGASPIETPVCKDKNRDSCYPLDSCCDMTFKDNYGEGTMQGHCDYESLYLGNVKLNYVCKP